MNQPKEWTNELLLVEFFGCPGVGKTTVASEVINGLRESGFDVASYPDFSAWLKKQTLYSKALFALTGAVKTLGLFAFGLKLIRTPDVWSWFQPRRTIRLFAAQQAFADFHSDRRASIYIFDQWIHQRIWSLAKHWVCMGRAAEFYKDSVIPVRRITIVADAPLETIARRLSLRFHGSSRFETTDPHKAERALKRMHAQQSGLLSILLQPDDGCSVIDCSAPVQVNARQVLDFIQSQCPLWQHSCRLL